MLFRFACAAAVAVSVVSSSMAAGSFVPAPVLTEGQPLPGSPFTNTGSGLLSSFVATNAVGGWAASVVTNDGSYVVGRASAGAAVGPILRGNSVGITGGFGQGIGLDDAGRALVSGGGRYVLGTTASHQIFHVLGTAIPEPLAGLMNASGRNHGDILWTFGLGFDGTPVYRATARNAAGTSNERWAMVRGLPTASPGIIVQTEQVIPNFESPTTPGTFVTLSAPGSARAFGIGATSFARTGGNSLVEGILRTGINGVTTSDDQVMLLNGNLLSLGGGAVRERSVISPAIGGLPQEDWRIFRTAAINSSGSYLFTAQAFQVGGGLRELFVKDGQILYRTGSTLPFGAITLTVSDQAGTYQVALNEAGDWAMILPTTAGRTLVVNGQPILLAGSSLVDTTGDGLGNALLTFIKADLGQLALGERVNGQFDVFFYGSTSPTGSSPLSLFVVTVPEPASVAGLAVAGLVALRRRR